MSTAVHSHISEHVLGEHNTVELSRVGDHDHSCGINELVLELELRVFLRHELGDSLPPKTRGGEDIGFVDGDDGEWWVGGESDLRGDSGDTLDFRDRVDGLVPRDTLGVGFLAFTEVYTSVCSHRKIQLVTVVGHTAMKRLQM